MKELSCRRVGFVMRHATRDSFGATNTSLYVGRSSFVDETDTFRGPPGLAGAGSEEEKR